MARLRYLSEALAQDVVTRLTEQVFPESPAFRLRGEQGSHALLSALGQPRWAYYRTLQEKAGVLHYSLNKNHPFTDGNKRFALTAMDVFLLLNDAVLLVSAAEAENFALGVADGSISKEESIAFVCRRTLRFRWSAQTQRRWFQRLSPSEQQFVAAETGEPTSRFRTWPGFRGLDAASPDS